MKPFTAEFVGHPHRTRTFSVRGVCRHDILNPCWDNRSDDVPGQHWGGGVACVPCTNAAKDAAASSDRQYRNAIRASAES